MKGNKTEDFLRKIWSSELEAQARYQLFAAVVRKAGQPDVADLLFSIAGNEAEHAKSAFRLLGWPEGTKESLQAAIEREAVDSQELYPMAAQAAEEEGNSEALAFFRRARDEERRHHRQLSVTLRSLERNEPIEGKTVSHSAVEMAHVMLPHHANPTGVVHGGELMKLMDNAAAVVAVRHSRCQVATASVDELRFVHPVQIGNVVIVKARMTFVSRAIMEVRVEVEAEDLASGKKVPAVDAYFVMIALNAEGRPVSAPTLVLCTSEEEQIFQQAGLRYHARKARTDLDDE
ncbi:MAG TPA: hotdog domain-containing protein [Thermodesulfobacteriota bacterium]|nr:hypothetical protein [Deltaproteobacteria bacterium]HNR12781.1 hotdog domain-containing protein [Thermodesulfobacteriota bacterium]HNU70721.1 hotdog domain-containing protein [Thermodesulfobacteriota bacterium]HQO78604.1 hotdog domain-containing protein [Thermodesulfobacteriota bacterium]